MNEDAHVLTFICVTSEVQNKNLLRFSFNKCLVLLEEVKLIYLIYHIKHFHPQR